MEIYALKINGLENPIGYDDDLILCSWKVRKAEGKKQKQAVITIATDEVFEHVIWQKKGNLNPLAEKIDATLEPYTRYYVRVRVTSDSGEEAVSATHYFETAKLCDPWQADWIGVADGDTHPEFLKRFSLKKPVRTARLYICGLGIFEASLNGKKVGKDFLAPFINDYDEHYQYCTYDITDHIAQDNTLSVLLGDGWYRGYFGLGHMCHPEKPLALIAEIRIVYDDGTIEMICTDESWRYRKSFTELSDIYMGETQNYRDWVPEAWKSAKLVAAPGNLCARYSPPLYEMQRISVKEIIHTPAGETVLDFGQNFAGHVVCTQEIPENAVMTWEFGEILQGGNFYHGNYRTAESKFTYMSDGKTRVIRPRFTFFGFRYMKICGIHDVDVSKFEGRALYSEMDQTGFIETGNSKINRLFQNSLWSLKSNFIDMPTDCPQRDERLGWTGDAQIFSTTAGFHMDTRAFYSKFLRDLRSDQLRNNGCVAVFLPNALPGLCTGIWSDIAAFLPHMLYEYYGSIDILKRYYPLMKDWVDYIYRQDVARGQKDLYDFGFQFGDWLALDGATEHSKFGRTDNGFVCSAYYWASTHYVAQAAKALGFDEAKEYEERADRIRGAILNEYFTATGRLAIDTQTGYLVALKFDIYRDKQKVIDGFKNRYKQDLRRLKGGFIGSTMMNCVLADNGMAQQAYDLLLYEGFPGWLYAVNLGATTIWERWNSVLGDGSMNSAGMNSLNHYSYGSVVEFLYRHAAGISQLKPGFTKVKIEPKPDIRLGKLHCAYDSASGQYVSDWDINKDGSLSFHIEIPFGCEAEVYLPEKDRQVLDAGIYDFTITTAKDYRSLFTADTPYERLITDERALSILEKYLPDVVASTNPEDTEAMSKSLNDLRDEFPFLRQSTDAYDKAIAEICVLHG